MDFLTCKCLSMLKRINTTGPIISVWCTFCDLNGAYIQEVIYVESFICIYRTIQRIISIHSGNIVCWYEISWVALAVIIVQKSLRNVSYSRMSKMFLVPCQAHSENFIKICSCILPWYCRIAGSQIDRQTYEPTNQQWWKRYLRRSVMLTIGYVCVCIVFARV